MPRPIMDFRISLKGRSGKCARITGYWCEIEKVWIVYRDGKRSRRLPKGSSTDIAKLIRVWLHGQK